MHVEGFVRCDAQRRPEGLHRRRPTAATATGAAARVLVLVLVLVLAVVLLEGGEKLGVVAHTAVVGLLLGHRQVRHVRRLEVPQEGRVVAPVPASP